MVELPNNLASGNCGLAVSARGKYGIYVTQTGVFTVE